jgi:hypothetical protein
MRAHSADSLLDSAQIDASFTVARGELSGVDLVRTITAGGGTALRGGRTPFSELSGLLQSSAGRYSYRQLRLTSGTLDAKGNVDIGPSGQLNGRVDAEVSARGRVIARTLSEIGGTLEKPQLKR